MGVERLSKQLHTVPTNQNEVIYHPEGAHARIESSKRAGELSRCVSRPTEVRFELTPSSESRSFKLVLKNSTRQGKTA